jgi:subtilase family serine protease
MLSSFGYAVVPQRIAGDLTTGPKVPLRGNVHGLARPEFDLGRADGSGLIEGITLSLRPSPAQQQDLNQFLAQLGDPHSKNFHKYLTPAQFGERFGMNQSDLDKITAWLQKEGFANISVANGRNQVSFDGTVGQIESVFAMEMHNYLVHGEVHLANAGEPSVPAALSGIVGSLWHIDDFSPKPRVAVKPNLTSFVSGNHFLTPGDFAKIYDLGALYTAGGSGQKIAVIGQSTVNASDLNNFRSAAGLPASTVTMTVAGGTGTRCPGDEGESDLDIEWSGGVAQNANITFVFAGLGSGETCSNRANNIWNALNYVIQHNVAPFISTSYGFCESGLGQAFVVNTLQAELQQGQTQGQTLVAASGDSGAADCESSGSTSATTGLAVDAPSSIPEATGAGGNEFSGDIAGTVNGTTAGPAPPYWAASNAGSDAIVTALQYIPEIAWNDTLNINNTPPTLSATGGGASIFFAKPTWQTGTGVPADGKRDVPDISLTTSQFHDPYLICSEDTGSSTTQSTCTSGFRTGAGGNFSAVGGTSAAAPTFTAILALINQSLNNPGTTGLAPVNPMLYSLAATNPTAFHDVTGGDNKVPCTAPSTNCPTGTTTIGFAAGTGYDQVTGLGSVDVTNLATAWAAALAQYTLSASALSPASVSAGNSTTATITVAPTTGSTFTGTINYACSGLPTGATCSFNPTTTTGTSGTTTLTIQTAANMAAGTTAITVTGSSAGGASANTSVSLVVTATTMSYTLTTNLSGGTASVAQGQTTGAINIAVSSTSTPSFVTTSGSSNSTALPVTYTCSGNPTQSMCFFNGTSGSVTTQSTTVTLTITTTAPTGKMESPLGNANRIFYAALLPGMLGIVFMSGSRRRSVTRMLGLILVLGVSTLWIASCGGTNGSGTKNAGTPTGQYSVVVNATTGGAAPITSSVQFTLAVTP